MKYLIFIFILFLNSISFGQSLEHTLKIGAKDANNPPDNTVNLYYFTTSDYGSSECTINNWNIYFKWKKSDLECNNMNRGIVSATTLPPFSGVQYIALEVVELDGGEECAQAVQLASTGYFHTILQNTEVEWGQIEVNPSLEVKDVEITLEQIIGINGQELGESNITMYASNGIPVYQAIGPIDQGPLPVQLIKFTATKKDETSHLEWITSAEVGNDHFLIQNSKDGQEFETLGKVDGAGTTTSVSKYEFIDEKPYKGMNYYRLVQVDEDGKMTASPIRNVYFGIDKVDITTHPNPTTDFVLVDMSGVNPTLNSVDVVIYDTNGAEKLRKSVDQFGQEVKVDCNELAVGAYILKVVTADADILYADKLIKQ